MKKYLTLMAAAWLLVGCTSDEVVNPQGGDLDGAILFDVAGMAETRAPGMMDLDGTTQPVSLQDKGFGVFASYTALEKYETATVSTDFMYNQGVTYYDDGAGNTGWTYSPVKYWPNYTDDRDKEYVSFFAYAPYEADPQDDGRCIFAVSKNFNYGDPWVNYRLAENPWDTDPAKQQVDLCFGMHQDGTNFTPWTDQCKADYDIDDKLKFTFKHALSCIGDQISIKMADDLWSTINGYATVTIDKVTITYKNLTTKARLVLNSADGTPNWKEIISGELTCSRTITLDNTTTGGVIPFTFDGTNHGTDNLLSDQFGLLFIPLQIAGTEAASAEVAAEYTVVNNASETYNGVAKGTFKLLENAGVPYTLDPGQKNAIRITLTKDFDLAHLVYPLGGGSGSGPSYAPRR